MEDRIFHRQENIASREVDGEIVLVNSRNMQVHQLNRTASFVWEKCDGVHTVADIIESLTSEFDVLPETAQQEVIGLIAQLQQLDLITSHEGDR